MLEMNKILKLEKINLIFNFVYKVYIFECDTCDIEWNDANGVKLKTFITRIGRKKFKLSNNY
jgi:hypothetical protein